MGNPIVMMPRVLAVLALLAGTISPGPGAADEYLGSSIPLDGIGEMVANPATDRLYVRRFDDTIVVHMAGPYLAYSLESIAVKLGSLAIDPAANQVYGGIRDRPAVALIDGATHAVTEVAVAAIPGAVAINARTGRLYVTLPAANSLAVIDVEARTVTDVPLATTPNALAVNPVTNFVYVTSASDPVLIRVDGATNTVLPIALQGYAGDVVVDVAANRILMQHQGVTSVDGVTHAMASVSMPAYPRQIAVNPNNGKVYVGTGTAPLTSDGAVVVLDGATLAKTVLTSLGSNCCEVRVNASTNKAYASPENWGYSPSYVTMIDSSDVATNLSGFGDHLAVNPATNRIFPGTNYFSHGVSYGFIQVIDGSPGTGQPNGLKASIMPLANDQAPTLTPRFNFATSTTSVLPVQRVYYRLDDRLGPWQAASGSGNSWTATVGPLTPGVHKLYAYAVDARAAVPRAPLIGEMAAYTFTVTNECTTAPCTDVSVTHNSIPAQGYTNKDVVFHLTASNAGPNPATNVVLTDLLPPGSSFVWASPGCSRAGGVVTCELGTVAIGASTQITVVARPSASGSASNTASIVAAELDAQSVDNQSVASVPVTDPAAANLVFRYRLYSPVTLEHHFTTDFNEYNVLGTYSGTWVQEGNVGKVLDNPGSFAGVTATPYYRLYNTVSRWHHWTTDPNEYYTLIQYPGWNAEGVDGYLLPSAAAGTTQLYRLNYPYLPGLHHWTIDANEYSTLIGSYGWIGEGGSGFVVQ